jgi:hypothetical protein
MRWFPSVRYPLVAVVVAAGSVAPAWGQTTIFDSHGFETSGGYSLGTINSQNGFQATPPTLFVPQTTTAGQIVNSPTFGGSGQALKIVGSQLVDSPAPPFGFNGGNFFYQSYTSGTGPTAGYNPFAPGNSPIVRGQAQVRTSGAIGVGAADIPFAGLHFEGFTANGNQQSLSPIYVNMNGGITVFTNNATSQGTFALTTTDLLVPREEWHQLAVEFNFTAQTFRVFLDGSTTPVQFTRNGSNAALPTAVTDVPFRNTNGPTVQIAEIGVLAFYGRDPGGTPYQPLNDFFVDDFVVTGLSPVPEPGLMVAVGFAAVAAGGGLRRWRRGAKPQAA